MVDLSQHLSGNDLAEQKFINFELVIMCLKISYRSWILGIVLFPSILKAQQGNNTKDKYQFDNKPSWSDEFDKEGLPDTSKWSYETGGSGWGNHELEYYTAGKNAAIHNGILTIEARKEDMSGMKYTSTRMVTRGKGDFLYGRFEIRARLSDGKGLWPAIWMLPTTDNYGGWPNGGEVDIMEQVGYAPDSIHISIHTQERNWMKNNGNTVVEKVPTATSDFHIYRVDWTPSYIKGFIDGKEILQEINEGKGHGYWPFDKTFFVILNVAIGGDWGGQRGVDNSIFPAKMDVDYVRVYPLKNN